MGPTYIAIGFFKNVIRYLAVDRDGKLHVTEHLAEAAHFGNLNQAAVAAAIMETRTKLAHCRAIDKDEAHNARPL